MALAITAVDTLLGGAGLASSKMDNIVSVANLAVCAIYLHIAIGKVYGVHGAVRIAQVATLTLATAGIVVGYRFALFLITLYGT